MPGKFSNCLQLPQADTAPCWAYPGWSHQVPHEETGNVASFAWRCIYLTPAPLLFTHNLRSRGSLENGPTRILELRLDANLGTEKRGREASPTPACLLLQLSDKSYWKAKLRWPHTLRASICVSVAHCSPGF